MISGFNGVIYFDVISLDDIYISKEYVDIVSSIMEYHNAKCTPIATNFISVNGQLVAITRDEELFDRSFILVYKEFGFVLNNNELHLLKMYGYNGGDVDDGAFLVCSYNINDPNFIDDMWSVMSVKSTLED